MNSIKESAPINETFSNVIVHIYVHTHKHFNTPFQSN
jgi:hypothetical protein